MPDEPSDDEKADAMLTKMLARYGVVSGGDG
jgi:hypothetical protein